MYRSGTTDAQLDAMGQILTGQAGGAWFELLASIVTEVKPPAIAPIVFNVSGKKGEIRIGDVIENRFAPISNPVNGVESSVQVRIAGGLEYAEDGTAEILRSDTMVSTDEIAFDCTACHTSLVPNQTFGNHR